MKKIELSDRQLTVLFVIFLTLSTVYGLCGFLAGRALYGRKLRRQQ
jgi:hypothetical protein